MKSFDPANPEYSDEENAFKAKLMEVVAQGMQHFHELLAREFPFPHKFDIVAIVMKREDHDAMMLAADHGCEDVVAKIGKVLAPDMPLNPETVKLPTPSFRTTVRSKPLQE